MTETIGDVLTIGNKTVLNSITDRERDITKSILATKRHLGPLGMIEYAFVIARLLAEGKIADEFATTAEIGEEAKRPRWMSAGKTIGDAIPLRGRDDEER